MNSKSQKAVLVLLSGGIDSTALLKYYLNLQYRTTSLFINYGHLSNSHEYNSAKKISDHYNIKIAKIDIDFHKKFSAGNILGRNLMLISNALTYFQNGTGTIAIGIHSGTEYNDCSNFFMESIKILFDLYSDGKIQVEAPFINMRKQEIWQYCIDNNVPVVLTYSCENGIVPSCGNCLSCKDKESLNEFSSKL